MAGDGCNTSCLIETGEACNVDASGALDDASCASANCDTTGGGAGVCAPASSCGNGVLEAGEGCDDENNLAGDGCNTSCLIEDAQPCNCAVPGATYDASCASGVCDTSVDRAGVCEPASTCGNGVVEAGEGCDDGDTTVGDGCSASCLVEDGMTCNDDTAGTVDGPSCASGYCDSRGTCSTLGVSGGGCDAGASGAGTGGALVLLASLWLLATLRRRGAVAVAVARACVCGAVVAVLAVVIGPSAASAQVSTGFSAERFELTSFRDGILGVEWADARGNGVFDFGFSMGYANDPVNVYEMSTGDQVGSLVHNRLGGDLVAATRLKDLIELNFGASLIFAQSEDLGASTVGSDITSGGLGDIRLGGKFTVVRRGGTAVALLAKIGIPTSTVADYGGDTWATFSPAVAVSRTQGAVRLAANLGYVMRKPEESLDLAVDDELFLRLGAGYRFASSLEVDGTFDLATAANDLFGAFNRNHAELRGGASFDVTSALRVFGAVGAGLAEGFGTPDWRALVGLRFGTSPKPPAEPAPLPPLPEPPKDTDGDGLIDVADRCPTEAETVNSFEDADGCPDDPDPDHDTVIGTADQCPDAPEDLDGFEDGNGCPDPDNDADTVLDTDDACRDVPGVVTMKGCPDPDRDGDTVVDRLDNCVDEPGEPANQGCKVKQLVVITGDKLDILETVFFKTNKAVIEKRSYNLLDNVAAVLASHKTIRVEVEGHTDDVGNDAYNKKLSQSRAEAVVAYLVRKGVDAGRLQARGYGEEKPVVDTKTKVGRATNRRVVFTILSAIEGVKTQSNGPTEDTIDR